MISAATFPFSVVFASENRTGADQKNKKKVVSKMFSVDRKYFRLRGFHLNGVLLLVLFFASPTQAFNIPKGCAEVLKNPMDALVQDPKFVMNGLDCLQGTLKLIQETDWKTVQAMIPKEVHHFIQNIPKLMDKAKPLATKGGLVLLSLYLGYRSIELYEHAKNLEIDYRKHQADFEMLQVELTPIIAFIDTEIVPQWKNGKTAYMPRKIEKLIQMLSRYSNVLRELVQVIHKDSKRGSSDSIWSAVYGVAAVSVCAGSVFTGEPVVIIITCGIGVAVAAICYETYVSLVGQTLEKLDFLWEDTTELRTVITKYHVILQLVKLKDEM